jgi:hypothetical protein
MVVPLVHVGACPSMFVGAGPFVILLADFFREAGGSYPLALFCHPIFFLFHIQHALDVIMLLFELLLENTLACCYHITAVWCI